MFGWLRKKENPDEMPDYPKIYVTDRGKMYVKPDDIFKSKKGLERLHQMIEFEKRQRARNARLQGK